MKCSNCGNESEGKFCGMCGAKIAEPEANRNYAAAKRLLIDPAEEVKSVLCNTFLQTFISTGTLGNGFAILTNKRVYFKGKCFFRNGRGFYSKIEEKTVDLKDVTGTGFVHNRATWAKIARTTCLIVAACFIPSMLVSVGVGGPLSAAAIFTALAGIFHLIYKTYNYSVFEISYAGGGIAFDMNWITPQESKEFQQQLVLLKQVEKGKEVSDTPIKFEPEPSIPQQLKEYKELFDRGIITQEEFDVKKKELLTK